MTLNTPSSVSVGVRPMMASTRPYSSALRPKLRARDSVDFGSFMGGVYAAASASNSGLPSVAAHQRVHQVLGMRHQAEHAQVGAEDAGDGAGAAVEVGLRRHLAGPGGVAERDQVLAFQPVQRGVVGEIVAVAMRHDAAEGLAGLVVAGERGVGALDAQVAIHRQEAQRGVAQQGAGQHAGLGQDLKAVADAQDVAAAGGVVVHGAHDRGLRGHGAAAQVVAEAEAAGDDDQVDAGQVGVLVPQHLGVGAEGGFQRDGHVALPVDAGEDDDAGFHGGCRGWTYATGCLATFGVAPQ